MKASIKYLECKLPGIINWYIEKYIIHYTNQSFHLVYKIQIQIIKHGKLDDKYDSSIDYMHINVGFINYTLIGVLTDGFVMKYAILFNASFLCVTITAKITEFKKILFKPNNTIR